LLTEFFCGPPIRVCGCGTRVAPALLHLHFCTCTSAPAHLRQNAVLSASLDKIRPSVNFICDSITGTPLNSTQLKSTESISTQLHCFLTPTVAIYFNLLLFFPVLSAIMSHGSQFQSLEEAFDEVLAGAIPGDEDVYYEAPEYPPDIDPDPTDTGDDSSLSLASVLTSGSVAASSSGSSSGLAPGLALGLASTLPFYQAAAALGSASASPGSGPSADATAPADSASWFCNLVPFRSAPVWSRLPSGLLTDDFDSATLVMDEGKVLHT
jgi:hypothetical protein